MLPYTYPPVPIINGQSFLPNHHDSYPFIDPVRQSKHAGTFVFVTEASKGVGRATAISFARAGAAQIAVGARSSLTSLESEILAAARSAGKPAPKILALESDVESPEFAKAAAKAVKKGFGRLDILINNAGYLETAVLIGESDPSDYWKVWNVNYRGAYYVTRELLPLLLTTEGRLRTIVNYAPKGLVAFAVHPGGVATELGMRLPEYMHPLLKDKPELAGDSIAWLTHERREWLAGRYISCNWDMEELIERKDEIVEGDKLKVKLVL